MNKHFEYPQENLVWATKHNPHNRDFSCIHCAQPVSASPLISRVQNRNHCPYCLWSRHLDLYEAGDRLSACKGAMRPIGITFKRARNRYASGQGELMIVHRCADCGRLSLNRAAADDDPDLILSLPELSTTLKADVIRQLKLEGIDLVQNDRIYEVRKQLQGALCG